MVCQIGKIKGGFVIASAGSDEKIAWLREEAGVDYAFNYKRTENILAELRRAAPEGLDVYFENVGGDHLDAALRHMKVFGRIPVCGMISRYDGGQPYAITNGGCMLTMRLKLQGFIVYEHLPLWPEALAELVPAVAEGRIRYRESIVEGLEQAPAAMLGLHRATLRKKLKDYGLSV